MIDTINIKGFNLWRYKTFEKLNFQINDVTDKVQC